MRQRPFIRLGSFFFRTPHNFPFTQSQSEGLASLVGTGAARVDVASREKSSARNNILHE